MTAINELRSILSCFLKWNKARLDCFTKMLLALFSVKTVNLRELAVAFESSAHIDSRYKRLKRFFSTVKFDEANVAEWIVKLFNFDKRKIYLALDRTTWCWGRRPINLLILSVVYEGLAIPLFWKALNKKGNATAKEHGEMIERFIRLFGKEHIAGVLADREFASGEFFNLLNTQSIPFYIRIKEGSTVAIGNKKIFSAAKIFRSLKPKDTLTFGMSVDVFGQRVYLTGSRSERGELMVVATNAEPKQAILFYLRRWEIENLFQSLKSRGFRFKDTHLTKLDRVEKLMSLLAIGFCWAHKVGEWRAIKKPIVFNRYAHAIRPQFSYFKYGFELIRDALFHFSSQKQKLKSYIQHLLLPPPFSTKTSYGATV